MTCLMLTRYQTLVIKQWCFKIIWKISISSISNKTCNAIACLFLSLHYIYWAMYKAPSQIFQDNYQEYNLCTQYTKVYKWIFPSNANFNILWEDLSNLSSKCWYNWNRDKRKIRSCRFFILYNNINFQKHKRNAYIFNFQV